MNRVRWLLDKSVGFYMMETKGQDGRFLWGRWIGYDGYAFDLVLTRDFKIIKEIMKKGKVVLGGRLKRRVINLTRARIPI